MIVAETSVDYKYLYKYFNNIFKTDNFNIFLREKKVQVVSKSLYKYKNNKYQYTNKYETYELKFYINNSRQTIQRQILQSICKKLVYFIHKFLSK